MDKNKIMKKSKQIALFLFFLLKIPFSVLCQNSDTIPLKGFLIVHYYQYSPDKNDSNIPLTQGCAYFMDTVNFLHFIKNINTRRSSNFYYLYNILDTTNLTYTFISKQYINQQPYIGSYNANPIEYFDIYDCNVKKYNAINLRDVPNGFYEDLDYFFRRKIKINNYKYIYHYLNFNNPTDFLHSFLFRISPITPQYYLKTRFSKR